MEKKKNKININLNKSGVSVYKSQEKLAFYIELTDDIANITMNYIITNFMNNNTNKSILILKKKLFKACILIQAINRNKELWEEFNCVIIYSIRNGIKECIISPVIEDNIHELWLTGCQKLISNASAKLERYNNRELIYLKSLYFMNIIWKYQFLHSRLKDKYAILETSFKIKICNKRKYINKIMKEIHNINEYIIKSGEPVYNNIDIQEIIQDNYIEEEKNKGYKYKEKLLMSIYLDDFIKKLAQLNPALYKTTKETIIICYGNTKPELPIKIQILKKIRARCKEYLEKFLIESLTQNINEILYTFPEYPLEKLGKLKFSLDTNGVEILIIPDKNNDLLTIKIIGVLIIHYEFKAGQEFDFWNSNIGILIFRLLSAMCDGFLREICEVKIIENIASRLSFDSLNIRKTLAAINDFASDYQKYNFKSYNYQFLHSLFKLGIFTGQIPQTLKKVTNVKLLNKRIKYQINYKPLCLNNFSKK